MEEVVNLNPIIFFSSGCSFLLVLLAGEEVGFENGEEAFRIMRLLNLFCECWEAEAVRDPNGKVIPFGRNMCMERMLWHASQRVCQVMQRVEDTAISEDERLMHTLPPLPLPAFKHSFFIRRE